MAKKFNGKVCPECGEGRLRHGTKQISFTYRGETLIYGQVGAWCSHCDEGVMTGTESASTAAEVQAFMDKVDEAERMLLLRVRRKLRLTQKQAAALTGGGHNAFSRYERGEARPVPAVVNLFRVLDKHPELIKELAA
jgi:HTH-type transcriptional regulator / antitoxin MqsA